MKVGLASALPAPLILLFLSVRFFFVSRWRGRAEGLLRSCRKDSRRLLERRLGVSCILGFLIGDGFNEKVQWQMSSLFQPTLHAGARVVPGGPEGDRT